MKTKVCFLCPKAYPIFNKDIRKPFGGSEVELFLLGKELSRYEGLDVSFIVADYGQPEKETVGNIVIHRSFKFKDHILKRICCFMKALGRVRADVYVQSALNPFSGPIAIFSRIMGGKLVYISASDCEVDGRYEEMVGRPQAFFSKLVFRFSRAVVAQNTIQKAALDRKRKRNVFRLYYGMRIDPGEIAKDDYVLWVGRSIASKNPQAFLDLAESRPNRRFIMISPGKNSAFHREVRNRAERLKNVEFIEYVPFDEIDSYFKRARVFVSTSDMEGFSLAFIQAVSSRTPIVSLTVDTDGFLESNKCGFLCRGDTAVLAEKMDKLFSDESLYSQMSSNAFMYADRHHNIANIAKQFREILEVI